MSLKTNNAQQFIDDWQDVKEANQKIVEQAAAAAKENHVTQTDVDKKIAKAIASSGGPGGISENKVDQKITTAINKYKSNDKDYYIKSVSVSNGNLVLTYNEGKNPATVSLSSFGFASSSDLAGKQDKLTDTQINALADLTNFVTMATLNDYCKKSEVDSKILTEIAKVVANADADFDTLKEIADWIKNDTSGAAKMAADIDEIKSQVENFLTKTQADGYYQQKGEYITASALEGYAKSTDVESTYAKKSEVSVFTTETDVNTIIDGKNFLTETALEGYAKSTDVESTYAKKSEVSGFTTESDVNTIIDGKNFLTETALEGYAKSADIENDYQPKGDYLTASALEGYASKTDLNGLVTEDELEGKGFLTEATLGEDFAKKSDISTALEDYTTTAILEENYATKAEIDGLVTETELNEKGYLTEATLGEDFAKKSDISTALEDYTTTTDLETNYATKAELENYATDASIAEAIEGLNFLTENDLEGYATDASIAEAVESLATKAELENYATDASVAEAIEGLNFLTENDLEGYATDASVAEHYQEKGDYLTQDALNGYATSDVVETGFANIAQTYQAKLSAEQLDVLATDMSKFVKSVNGQTPDNEGNVDVTVPENVSELTNDSNFTSVNEVNRMLSKLLTRIEVLEKNQTNLAVASTSAEIAAIPAETALQTNLVLTSTEAVEAMTSSETTFKAIAVVGGDVDSTIKLNATDSVVVDGIEIGGGQDGTNNGKINYKTPEIEVKNLTITDETTTVYNMFEGSQTPNDASSLNKTVTFSNIYIDDVKLTHNIINVYTPAENAVLTVKDSYFNLDPENSNVMRIANYANSKNITINFENVEWNYEDAGKTDFTYAGLLLYQPAQNDAMLQNPANAEAISTMTINFKNCKYNGELVSSVNLGEHNQIAYIYNAGNARQIENLADYGVTINFS